MKTNQAFTLIELLVVVLIIGILAAVAVPQYKKAVERSKATQAITLLKSVYNAAKAYQLASGEWPESFDELAVNIPWTGSRNGINLGHHKQGKSNADWSIQIRNSPENLGGAKGIIVLRLSGPYAGAAFAIHAVPAHSQYEADELVCIETPSGTNYTFSKPKGSYCSQIMKGTFIPTTASWDFFRLP